MSYIKLGVLLSRFIVLLVHSTSQYAWKVITSLSFRMNSLIGSKAISPFHQPEVIGCEGLAERAQEKTLIQKGKLARSFPELPTSL